MSEFEQLTARIAEEAVEAVDLRFTDLLGDWRQISVPVSKFEALVGTDEQALTIDGAQIDGWQEVAQADLMLRPISERAFLDPYTARPTMAVFAEAMEPGTGLDYERDTRSVARRAEDYLLTQNAADKIKLELELGCHLVERAHFDIAPGRCAAAFLDARITGSDQTSNPPSVPRSGTISANAAMAMPPVDPNADIRAEMVSHLAMAGVPGVGHRCGAASALNEFELPGGGLVEICDHVQIIKFIVHQVAASYGRTASFLARPIPTAEIDRTPGAGLFAAIGLFRRQKPLFAGNGYADLSPECLHFIGGILHHGRALNALANPTTNSYRRLRAGRDAPALFAYAAHNRSAAIRIPYARKPDAKRVEVRFGDPAANPYLALSAIMMAGIDGISRRLEPGGAVDRNLYDLTPEDGLSTERMCRSLDDALDALDRDHEFLLAGDVFSEPLLNRYIALKRREIERIEAMPHPMELALTWS